MTSYGDKWLGHPYFDAGLGGAQPPQGHGLHPSDRRQLLRQPGAGRAARRPSNAAPTRPARIASLIFSGTVAEVPGHQLDLVARRRRADVVRRALPGADGERRRPTRTSSRASRCRASSTASITTPRRSRWRGRSPRSPSSCRSSQIVYGTDFPYRTAADHTKGVAAPSSAATTSTRSTARTRCGSFRGSKRSRSNELIQFFISTQSMSGLGHEQTKSDRRIKFAMPRILSRNDLRIRACKINSR